MSMAESVFSDALDSYYGRNGKEKNFELAAKMFRDAAELGIGRASMYLMLIENAEGPSFVEKTTWDPKSASVFETTHGLNCDAGEAGRSCYIESPPPTPSPQSPPPEFESERATPFSAGVKKRVCVIGAGMSGLTCARHLLKEGHEVVVFEQAEQLGGNWVYRKGHRGRATHSSCYENLCTNTFRDSTAFSDFPMPPDFPPNPRNAQVLQYFQLYADRFELNESIELNTTVVFVDKRREAELDGRAWRVVTKTSIFGAEGGGASSSIGAKRHAITNERGCAVISAAGAGEMVKRGTAVEHHFDAVAVCNGHHWDPLDPANIKGMQTFKGEMLHSHDYRSPREFTGKRVIVAGMGISGNDIARDLDGHAALVAMSTRRFDPAWAGSGGGAEAAEKALTHDGILGRLLKAFTKHDDTRGKDIVPSEARKKIGSYELWPSVVEVNERGVIFECGTFLECDAIIWCTGYHISFPFLSDELGIHVERNPDRVGLFKHCWPPTHAPTLIFLSLVSTNGSIHPIGESQAKWFAKVLSGKSRLPSVEEMNAAIADWSDSRCRNKVMYRPLQVDLRSYCDMCASMAKLYHV